MDNSLYSIVFIIFKMHLKTKKGSQNSTILYINVLLFFYIHISLNIGQGLDLLTEPDYGNILFIEIRFERGSIVIDKYVQNETICMIKDVLLYLISNINFTFHVFLDQTAHYLQVFISMH